MSNHDLIQFKLPIDGKEKTFIINKITPPIYRKNVILKDTLASITTPEELEGSFDSILLQFCDVFGNQFSKEDIDDSDLDMYEEIIPQMFLASMQIYNRLFIALGEDLVGGEIDEDANEATAK